MAKFRQVFTGDATALRDALVAHFKTAEEEMQRTRDANKNGADYAAGLDAGRQGGYREVRYFLKNLVITDRLYPNEDAE